MIESAGSGVLDRGENLRRERYVTLLKLGILHSSRPMGEHVIAASLREEPFPLLLFRLEQ